MACVDDDPALIFKVARILSAMHYADEVSQKGVVLYEKISRAAKLGGLRDFESLIDLGMDAETLAIKQQQMFDVIRIFSQLDGVLTGIGQQRLVKQLWSGGATDKFISTLGEMYTMWHVQKYDLATVAAVAQLKDASNGFLFLAQVPDESWLDRTYDCVVVLRDVGDTAENFRTIVDANVIMRIETKWYELASTSLDTSAVREQFLKGFFQSWQRNLGFADTYYGMPANTPFRLDDATELLTSVFENEFTDVLKTANVSSKDIAILRDQLERQFESMVFLVEDSSS